MSEIKLYLNNEQTRYICEYDVLTTIGETYEEALEKMNSLMKVLCEYDWKQYNKFWAQLFTIRQKPLEPEFVETIDKHFWDIV